ncbi:MAG: SDR family oxidoreductase [candidate division NC10 bacterium]|nr:SDR family oxidoreductase [candidate division NC10 bacterium]
MRLQGKVSIITGAGSGLGKEIALLFAREGSKVVIAELQEESGQATAQQIQKEGKSALFLRTDITRASEVERMVEEALQAYGRIDVLVNNAGINPSRTPVHETSEEAWDQTLAVNLKGAFLCSKYVLPIMMKQKGGSILHIASIVGAMGCSDRAAYAASKGGLIGLGRSMAVDYAPYGIRVNTLNPGFIETELTRIYFGKLREQDPKKLERIIDHHPLGRLGKAEDVAYAALFLASDESPWITGLDMGVDGGFLHCKRI